MSTDSLIAAMRMIAAAEPDELASAGNHLGRADTHTLQIALTKIQDTVIGVQAGLPTNQTEKVAQMRDIQRAYAELLEVMEYPIDQNGRVHDLNAMFPSALGIAWTAVLYGFRRTGVPYIKKRHITGSGVYENACTWVPVDAPDDAARDLKPGDYSDDRLRPPDVRGMAAQRDGEGPQVSAEWHTKAEVTYTDEPRPKD